MPFRVGEMVRYEHPLSTDETQLSLYHYGREHLDGKLALILDVSHNSSDYFCFINGDRMWINEAVLYEVEENENKKKNS